MAGTLFGLALSQQHDSNGRPLAGGKLYVFDAGTQTARQTYTDSGLTTGNEHSHPLELDSNGRVPVFWLSDGSARARLTDSAGVVQFDEDMLVLGASSGEGGGDTTDANALFQTGDMVFSPSSGTRSGWVRANGRTMGNAASGASERANADTSDLFTFIYTHFSDTLAPVSGGRGASAAVDYAANKTITLPDLRARTPFGLDDMGNSAASRLASGYVTTGAPTTVGSVGGDDEHTLTTAQIAAHTHSYNDADANYTVSNLDSGGVAITHASSDTENAETSGSTGGGTAHNNMPPFILGTWYIFLG